jgi:GMP synthase (glutamine-hydrolysing)
MTHLLIVEGNTKDGIAEVRTRGGEAHSRNYAKVLENLGEDVTCAFAHPSEDGRGALPAGTDFSDFDGAVWTGSPLHVYKEEPPVLNQLAFAEALYASGTPIFGSCWGLQIMTRALGGRVAKNPRGREAGIARGLHLTKEGRAHPMYKGKAETFECFAVHLDDVEQPAPGAVVLAKNTMSPVQAASIEVGGGRFWGVQYHPEFSTQEMLRIFATIGDALVTEGTYESAAAVDAVRDEMKSGPAAYDRIELRNWLASL